MFERLVSRVLALGLVFSSACYSTSLLQDTRVLAPGRVRGMVGVGYAPAGASNNHFLVEAGARVGVARRLELQGKLTNGGSMMGGLKLSLRDDASPFRISLLTGAQYGSVLLDMRGEGWWAERKVFGVNLTPVFGFRLHDDVELLIAPDLEAGFKRGHSFQNAQMGPVQPGYQDPWFGLGARGAVALHVGTHVTFIPECSLLVVVAGPPVRPGEYNDVAHRTRPDDAFVPGDVRGQCGIGINMGSAYVPH